MREDREFLAGRLGRVDGETACRQAVQQILGDGAEVARALEYQEFVPDFLRVDVAAKTEPRQRKATLCPIAPAEPGVISNMAGVGTMSVAMPSSTVETVTVVCRL